MNRHELEQKLDALGGVLDRWPAADAEAARRLITADPACRALVQEVSAVDAAVRQATLAPLDAALLGRILGATTESAGRRRRRVGWRPLVPVGALALMLVAGFGFQAGYVDGLDHAQQIDLAAVVVGDLDGLRTLP